MDKEELDSNFGKRVPLNRRGNLMQDIKVPTYKEQVQYPKNEPFIEKKAISTLPVKPNYKKLYVLLWCVLLIAVVALGSALYFYKQNKIEPTTTNTVDYINSVNEIRKVAYLPDVSMSDATLSVVLNPEEAKNDPNPSFKFFNFFENALAGDYLLHYPNIEKYILYRPSTHQIINMMTIPLNLLNSQNATSTSTSTATSTSKK